MCNSQNEDLGPWLALFQLRELTLPQKHQLLERWPEPRGLLDTPAAELEAAGLPHAVINTVGACAKALREAPDQHITAAIEWQQCPARRILTLSDPLYPPALRELATPPLLLFVVGDASLLSKPQIAIVGSRNASPAGLETAASLAAGLSEAGLVITSGMALGVDTASHRGTLAANGTTIAVLGCGVDVPYPRRNARLAQQIAATGALVSEFPLSSPPRRENFPRRNRIVSGLSQGVLVIEAALKSGSLISANLAAQQGREVFAVPGSIYNPLSRGCHWLIRQGAKLVETAEDVLEELPMQGALSPIHAPQAARLQPQLSELEQQVLRWIDYHATSMDMLVARSSLDVNTLGQQLVSLELKGQIASVAGGYMRAPGGI